MRSAGRSTSGLEFLAVLLLFAISAFAIVPFSMGDRSVLGPPRDLDGIQQSLLLTDSVDKLLTAPGSFYDTAILYPDRNQLRSNEPYIGYAILALPLAAIPFLNDVDVFEVLRWVIVVICLTYAYLLFRAVGIDRAIAAAGALMCLSHPAVLNDIGRLNVLCIFLILPLMYHGLMAWTSGQLAHSIGLFVFAVLFPLCGMINATISVLAAFFVAPLLLRALAVQQRQKRLVGCLLPVFLAAGVDALLLAPWLLDRSDLGVYVSEGFLQIKHWNPMRGPERLETIGAFFRFSIGPGLTAALLMIWASVLIPRIAGPAESCSGTRGLLSGSGLYSSLLCVLAVVVDIGISSPPGQRSLPGLQLFFHVACYLTLLLYWRDQIRHVIATDESGIRNFVLILTLGVGVFVCLMSFGPVYVSNSSSLANHVLTMLLYVLSPLKAIREFYRLWIVGVLFLSVYATVRLGMALSMSRPIVRFGAAAAIVTAAMSTIYIRELAASANLEPPRELFELASHSRSAGALYVHPDLTWNTETGVWMIALARVLGRPTVNGYLGVAPAWFGDASRVLHRFPDAEAVWLLRKWKVPTVVSIVGDVGVGAEIAERVFGNATGVVYELSPSPDEIPHPSENRCVASTTDVRVDAELSPNASADGNAVMTITVPERFLVKKIEVAFAQSVVERMPESIEVYVLDGGGSVKVNQDRSGEWIESLAADALLHRRSPVATINLNGGQSGTLRVVFQKTDKPPLERIGLCGEWMPQG